VKPAAEFLVRTRVTRPAEVADEQWKQLLEGEYATAAKLVEEGALQGIWRIPGALENVSIWRAEDATALHELLTGLPLYPWADVSVTALARHPVMHPPQP
jgi:muconolactone D-isomerase